MQKFKMIVVSLYDYERIGHPQKAMAEHGFEYKYAVPQSLYDSWFFYCVTLPDGTELPHWAKVHDFDNANKHVGHGLSQEMADSINLWVHDNILRGV